MTGQARYVDDMMLPGMLHGVTVRSQVPRGTLLGIDFDPSIPWDEFTIVTAKDVPGSNRIALIVDDQPALADGQINHPEEPVVLLAHPDKHMAELARQRVTLRVAPLPPVFTVEDSLSGREVIWGTDNIFKSYQVERGNVDAVWNNAHLVVEGEYETGAQEQLYIEPNGMIALATQNDVTVWGSLQCPYYVHRALMSLFALPADRVRIVQMETGGGFGGKEEYP